MRSQCKIRINIIKIKDQAFLIVHKIYSPSKTKIMKRRKNQEDLIQKERMKSLFKPPYQGYALKTMTLILSKNYKKDVMVFTAL